MHLFWEFFSNINHWHSSHGLMVWGNPCHVTLHNGWLNILLQLKPDSLQWSSGSYTTHPCLSGLLLSLYSALVALAGSLSWNPFSTPCLRAFALTFFLRFNILQLSKQLAPSFSLKFLSYISSWKPIWLLYLKLTFVFPTFSYNLCSFIFSTAILQLLTYNDVFLKVYCLFVLT